MAASRALGAEALALTDPNGALPPPLEDARRIGTKIAEAGSPVAADESLAPGLAAEDIGARIAANFWTPASRPVLPACSLARPA